MGEARVLVGRDKKEGLEVENEYNMVNFKKIGRCYTSIKNQRLCQKIIKIEIILI